VCGFCRVHYRIICEGLWCVVLRGMEVRAGIDAMILTDAGPHRALLSIPTRRSSDLQLTVRPPPATTLAAALTRRLRARQTRAGRSEEHTSELQSRGHLVCRLLLEKKYTGWRFRSKKIECVPVHLRHYGALSECARMV